MTEHYPLRDLFPGLEDELYEELTTHGKVRDFPAGTPLLRKGQPIRATMLILEGIVKVYQEDNEGNEFFLYDMGPGEGCAVSMACTYRQEKSQVLAKALTPVKALMIPLRYMDQWMSQYKSWHYFVLSTWRGRYEELLNTINEIAFKNMDERLEFYIRNRVKKMGRQVNMTHQQIAKDLNTSREVVSRLLKKMEKDGLITIHRNSFKWIKQ